MRPNFTSPHARLLVLLSFVFAFQGCSKLAGPADFGMAGAQGALRECPRFPATLSVVSELHSTAPPCEPSRVEVLGFHRAGDAGGGRFYWNAESTSADDGGAIIRPEGTVGKGRWVREYSGPVNPAWFGAVGDGSGKTAKELGGDVLKAPWNQWPSWATGDYSPQYLVDMSQPPFNESTSYDQIGIQLALWHVGEGRGEVAIPAGKYAMTSALFYHNGMRASLSGAGLYQTILTLKRSCVSVDGTTITPCFGRKDARSENVLLYLYRIGAIPTVIRDLAFTGVEGVRLHNFTLVKLYNTNAVHLQRVWLTASTVCLENKDKTSDTFLVDSAAEYCDVVFKQDKGSDAHLSGNTLWQTYPYNPTFIRNDGIRSEGSLYATDNRFIGFSGFSIDSSGPLLANDNEFLMDWGMSAIRSTGEGAVISGNRITGKSRAAFVSVASRSTVIGNVFEQENPHPIVNLDHGSTLTTVSGNTFFSLEPISAIIGRGLIVSLSWNNPESFDVSTYATITGNSFNLPGAINVDLSKGHVLSGNVFPGP